MIHLGIGSPIDQKRSDILLHFTGIALLNHCKYKNSSELPPDRSPIPIAACLPPRFLRCSIRGALSLVLSVWQDGDLEEADADHQMGRAGAAR